MLPFFSVSKKTYSAHPTFETENKANHKLLHKEFNDLLDRHMPTEAEFNALPSGTRNALTTLFVHKKLPEGEQCLHDLSLIHAWMAINRNEYPELLNECVIASGIECLRINDAELGAQGAITIAQMLSLNNTLSEINLRRCNIGSEGTIAIAIELAKKDNIIKKIDLGYNKIDDKGTLVLSSALINNNVVTYVELNNNEIGNKGADYLAAALKRNSQLSHLGLAYNRIGYEGGKSIAEALSLDSGSGESAKHKKSNLHSISLSYNKLGRNGAIAFAEMLKKNDRLTTVLLGGNDFGVGGACLFAENVSSYSSLTYLNLQLNGLGDIDMQEIAQARIKYPDLRILADEGYVKPWYSCTLV